MSPEVAIVAPTMPVSQFRSLGGHLDYSDWPERERFLELDEAIRRACDQENSPAGRLRSRPVRSQDEGEPRRSNQFDLEYIDI